MGQDSAWRQTAWRLWAYVSFPLRGLSRTVQLQPVLWWLMVGFQVRLV